MGNRIRRTVKTTGLPSGSLFLLKIGVHIEYIYLVTNVVIIEVK